MLLATPGMPWAPLGGQGRFSERFCGFWGDLSLPSGSLWRPFGEPWPPNARPLSPNGRPKSIFEGILVDLSGGCLFGVSRGALRQGPICNPYTQAQSKCSFQKTGFGTQGLHFGVTLGGFWEALGVIWPPWGASWRFFAHLSAMFGLCGCSCSYVGFCWILGAGRGVESEQPTTEEAWSRACVY